jgi:hypothetical protein
LLWHAPILLEISGCVARTLEIRVDRDHVYIAPCRILIERRRDVPNDLASVHGTKISMSWSRQTLTTAAAWVCNQS